MFELPRRLEEKLLENREWHAGVQGLLLNVRDYFGTTPFFFPEYTNHGAVHQEHLLALCDRLIPDESLALLRPRELAVLLFGVFLHDIGMFVKPEGLFRVLFGDRRENREPSLEEPAWGEAWEDYLEQARRYDDKTLHRLFGEAVQVTRPPREIGDLTRKDILVYGDFLRRHHHRLAHEIAMGGFPGETAPDLFRGTPVEGDREIRDLAGLVARSHGMAMRETEPFLKAHFGSPSRPKSIHVFYLMAVLRIADYLDAGRDRAPHALRAMQGYASGVSQGEHDWNRAIDFADYDWQSFPETLFIHASPEKSSEYHSLTGWLQGVQQELDLSWAVIGEHYGIGPGNRLCIRRVDSNLFEPAYRKALSARFLPERAELGVNPDLLKLLVSPLYGDDPSYGVRELLQNAVDACRERRELEGPGYEGRVTVEVSHTDKTFTITDNGVGMSARVILDYYLVAGSSYRLSDEWAKRYGGKGRSRVNRTGRFGVGVLATFLLGGRARIRTRHRDDSRGYAFEMALDQEVIDVERCDMEVGTQVTVDLEEELVEAFYRSPSRLNKLYNTTYQPGRGWTEWYRGKAPQVAYLLEGRPDQSAPKENLSGWLRLPSSAFPRFYWRYGKEQKFYCNGIEIPLGIREKRIFPKEKGLEMAYPGVYLEDRENRLDLDLARNRVTRVPEKELFITELYKYLLAKLLVLDMSTSSAATKAICENFIRRHTHDDHYYWSKSRVYNGTLVLFQKGYILAAQTFLRQADVQALRVACFKPGCEDMCDLLDGITRPTVLQSLDKERKNLGYYKRYMAGDIVGDTAYYMQMYYSTEGLWAEKKLFEKDLQPRLQKTYLRRLAWQYATATHYYLSTEPVKDTAYLERHAAAIPSAFDYRITYGEDIVEDNLFGRVLDQYLGDDVWIPYDLADRKRKFHKAFKELAHYMKYPAR